MRQVMEDASVHKSASKGVDWIFNLIYTSIHIIFTNLIYFKVIFPSYNPITGDIQSLIPTDYHSDKAI